jgi:pimeloyl-ACP methyl ester carboxylesterase
MSGVIDQFDLWSDSTEFEVPIFFLIGRLDWQVPSVIASRYFEAIKAPYKKLIWFEESAHSPPTEEPQKFAMILIAEVLPLASSDAG